MVCVATRVAQRHTSRRHDTARCRVIVGHRRLIGTRYVENPISLRVYAYSFDIIVNWKRCHRLLSVQSTAAVLLHLVLTNTSKYYLSAEKIDDKKWQWLQQRPLLDILQHGAQDTRDG